MWYKAMKYVMVMLVVVCCSCNRNDRKAKQAQVFKGLYSFGPESKSFKNCDDPHEYWVADSSAQLELKYSQMNFEKPYEPVYVEVEGSKIASDNESMAAEFDSTLVVRKVLKITREIPQDLCN